MTLLRHLRWDDRYLLWDDGKLLWDDDAQRKDGAIR